MRVYFNEAVLSSLSTYEERPSERDRETNQSLGGGNNAIRIRSLVFFLSSVKICRTADCYSRPRHTSGTPLESSVSHLGIVAAGPRPPPPPTGLDCLPATPPPPHLLIRFFLRAQWSPNPSRTTLPSSLPGFSFSPPPLPPPFFFFVSRWNSVEE